jgi:superfamily II DNA/RNA helicase
MFLNENGVKCVNLNGNMPLDIRTGKLYSFQSGDVDVISCTDIGSRGIDTIRVSLLTAHVIYYLTINTISLRDQAVLGHFLEK